MCRCVKVCTWYCSGVVAAWCVVWHVRGSARGEALGGERGRLVHSSESGTSSACLGALLAGCGSSNCRWFERLVAKLTILWIP